MITSLQVQNFKGFGATTDEVRFAPITLIYGANTAGKSALIHALLLLKNQERPHAPDPDRLEFRGQAVDLGSYTSTVHRHRRTESVQIAVKWGGALQSGTSGGVALSMKAYGSPDGVTHVALSDVDFFLNGHTISVGREFQPYEGVHSGLIKRQGRPELPGYPGDWTARNVDAILGWVKANQVVATDWKMLKQYLEKTTFSPVELIDDQLEFSLPDLYGSFSILPAEVGDLNLIDGPGPDDLSRFQGALNDLNRDYAELVGDLRHVGPLRPLPNRDSLSTFGRTWFPQRGSSYVDKKERVDKVFAQLGLPYTVHFRQVRDIATGEHFHVELQDVRTKTKVSVLDTGTGVSQILPLIGVLAVPGHFPPITLVEQPELHLHPRLQANLAEAMAHSSQRKRPTPGAFPDQSLRADGPQWVIETHSELFILRLQRLIRKGQLDHRAVSVLYVDSKERTGSTVQELELDEDGEFLDEWPDGFFEEGYRELFQD